ncbi:MAG: hypothetical protein QW478_12605 [Candidatus Micrarchaeaceae archaeon]
MTIFKDRAWHDTMEKIISFIIDAKTGKNAIEFVKNILEDTMIGIGRSYAGYSFAFKHKPFAVLVNSKEGKRLIKEGIKITENNLEGSFKNLKESINNSNFDLFNNQNLVEMLYKAYDFSSDNNVYLYSNDGSRILTQDMLKERLNEKLEPGMKRYVIPVEVYY